MASVAGTRFAHTEGRVSLVYRWDGEKVFSLGMDGEMRVWAGIEDDDCENHLVGDEGFALAVSANRWEGEAGMTSVADPDKFCPDPT